MSATIVEKRYAIMNRTDRTTHSTPLPEGCTLLDPLPAARVRLQLSGTFAGAPILWEATIEAIGPHERSFLHVESAAEGRGTIRVGLPVAVIDGPTLHKSVIMVRQYRALRLGRHQFGAG